LAGHSPRPRAAAVNEKTLPGLPKQFTLDQSVRLGKGELQTGGNQKPSIFSSTFEALIAAIYIDGGFNAVYPVVRHLFAPLFRDQTHSMIQVDHKTQLQERIQAEYKVTPTYHLVVADGPDHAKTFEVEVRMNGEKLATARGSSKKEAEQNAARFALERSHPKTELSL